MYYGYYANLRGTPNLHLFYGNDIRYESGLPLQNNAYCYPVCIQGGNRLFYSQAVMRQMYANNSVSWAGGVNISFAFFKNSVQSCVKISGKCAYFVSGATRAFPILRVYSQNTGLSYFYSFEAYTNVAFNHVTFPIEIILTSAQLPHNGWNDVYFYSAGNINTDGNDQLWLNVEILPMSDF
jgi:hypothetical protein